MILNDFTAPKRKFSNEQLDAVLVELCGIVIDGQQDNPDFNGMVAAAVIDPKGRLVTGLNYLYGNYRVHAERAAIDKYEEEYGELPKGSIVVTTLSPCSERMDNRQGASCSHLLANKKVKLVYSGYQDPTQEHGDKHFVTLFTDNDKLKNLCKKFADTFLKDDLTEYVNSNTKHREGIDLEVRTDEKNMSIYAYDSGGREIAHVHFDKHDKNLVPYDLEVGDDYRGQGIAAVMYDYAKELGYNITRSPDQTDAGKYFWNKNRGEEGQVWENFADGKGPGRPGDSQRYGISKGASMAELEKASHAKGRKGQLARWQLNMRRGKKKTNEVINHPGIKTKGADSSGLVNKGQPVPPGKEAKLLGTKVGNLGAYEVYKWDKGTDSAYSVFDPKTRISQMTISGHNKPHSFEIFGIYGGPQSPVRAADLYAWLVKNQGLTLVSDKYQSPGGQRVWQELEQRYGRSVNVYAYNMRTNEPINTGADDPESTHGHRGDIAQNVRLVASPK